MSVPVSEYVPDFRPTHVVPRDGLPAWEAPDPGLPTAPLDAFLPVRLEERSGDWGRIRCSNGWTAWVDARLLVSVPDDPPAAGRPLTRTADPRPLIARAEDALGRYRRAAEELGAGRLDGEAFRLRTRGLRVGMVVDGESVWLYDAEHERWVYCDGAGLSTYAAGSAPSMTASPPAFPAAPAPAASASAGGDAEGDGHEPARAAPAGHDPTRV
ncbi:SH3 domain-containing protein, partial [Streptomyces cinereoruber]